MGISALLASQILDASATGRSVLTGVDASAIRTTLGLGTLATQSPTGTPSASTFLRGDYSWQTIDLSGYVPLAGGTMTGALAITQATANTSVLTSTGYSLTGSNAQSLIDVAGTWNTTGTPTAFKLNVTDTASNASSLLMDLQVGGSSRFSVSKAGEARGGNFSVSGTNAFQVFTSGTSRTGLWFDGGGGNVSLLLAANGRFAFGSSTVDANTPDTILVRDAAGTLAQRNSTNAQTFRIYNTFIDASNYERAKLAWESNVLRIGTEKAGTGSARALELQTDGTTRLTVTTAGRVELGTIAASANAPLRIQVDGAGRGFVISNSATDYTEFVSGGVVKGLICQGSVPFAVWNAGDIYFQCNNIEVLRCTSTGITASQNITLSTKNLVTDTTTGTKIGTATTQKLGFWNATPVVQPTAVADATDAASVITQLNALLSRMRDLGLIAT